MDYKEYAKDLLMKKRNLISAFNAIGNEIESLEQEKYACKTASVNKNQSTGGNMFEERLLGIIARLEDCRLRRKVVERELMLIEQGMSGLSDYQRELLEAFFVTRKNGVADELMDRFFKERSGLYRDRNRALEEFTRSVYGVVQL